MTIGGKRKGSGRKPVPNKKLKKCITLRPDHIEKMAGELASGVIEKALDKYFKGDDMKYTVNINENQTIENLTEKESIEQAELYVADGDRVVISWYRKDDGQTGYLNRDGHGITGQEW